MKFAGELIVKAPREEVFDRLKDAPFFASCVEGVRDLQGSRRRRRYTAQFRDQDRLHQLQVRSRGRNHPRRPPDAIAAKIEGKPHGIVGRLSATSSANFVEKDGGTAIQYAVEANLTGRLGSIGQPVLKSKAKEMERLFVQNLRNGLQTGVEEAAP